MPKKPEHNIDLKISEHELQHLIKLHGERVGQRVFSRCDEANFKREAKRLNDLVQFYLGRPMPEEIEAEAESQP